MIIKCHQAVKGSSSTQGYSAPMLESKDESRPGSTKSYSFVLNDDRRSIPDNDINNYVLEIEPVNGKFECTAAICTQYTDVGIPSVYTSWLMPEDGNSLTTLQILSRSSFMRGHEVADYYDNEKPLTMREVEVSTSADYSNWQITDASRRLIGQFLALYWMSLIQNQPALGKAGNQLFLLLRDPGNNQIMVNEDAVRFFRKEIASRLPLEAQNMISAVFGVKKSEAEKNFRKAVCVVLSSEVGVPSDVKIDLLRGNQDLFRKINSLEDREAMKAIAECLLAGEQNYPEWYIRLRQQLKDGIPKTAAPYLMYYSYVLQGLEQETYKTSNPLLYYEQGYRNILNSLSGAGTPEDEVQTVLYPLLEKIANLWCSQPRINTEFYNSKYEWLTNEAKVPNNVALRVIAPLTERIFGVYKNDINLTSTEKIKSILGLLSPFVQELRETYDVTGLLENYLSTNFEEWILMPSEETQDLQLPEACFSRILENWNSSGLRHQPEEVKKRLLEVVEQYPGIPEQKLNNAMAEVDRLCLKELIRSCNETEQRGEQLTTEMLRKLARQIVEVGDDDPAADISKPAFDLIRRNYHNWVLNEVVVFQSDRRFLDLTKEWLNNNVRSIEDYNSEQIGTLEDNIKKTLSDYNVSKDEQDQLLAGVRQQRGMAELQETIENETLDESVRALRIAGIHRKFRRLNGVLQGDDELSEKLNHAISDAFLAWNDAEKPFASSEELHYDDNWFVSVAEDWMKERLKDYIQDFDAKTLQTLENNIEFAFDKYNVSKEQKKHALSRTRIAKFEAQLHETINDNSISQTDKALKIAGIHKTLRKTDGLIDDASELVDRLQEEILDLFCDWQKAPKPFASSEELTYDDDWFVTIAEKWLNERLKEYIQDFDAETLQKLENDIEYAFSAYGISREIKKQILSQTRIAKFEAQLYETISDNSLNSTDKALKIAGIHRALKKTDKLIDDATNLVDRLQEEILPLFIDWQNAEKPFASDEELHYDDDWVIEVANKWIQYELANTHPELSQLESLEKNLMEVYGLHKKTKEQQNKDLAPLRLALCQAKLDEVRLMETVSDDPTIPLTISGLYAEMVLQANISGIDVSENIGEIKSILRETFVVWSKAEKPFATGLKMRYEDADFFEEIAHDWLSFDINNTTMDSGEMEQLIARLTTAFNSYKISREKQNEMLLSLQKAWAMARIHDIQTDESMLPENQALCIAETHLKLRRIKGALEPQDKLSEAFNNAMLERFTAWEKTERPFMSGTNKLYEDDWFIEIAEAWLAGDSGNRMEAEELSRLEKNLRTAFNGYQVPIKKQDDMLKNLRQNLCRARLFSVQQDMNPDDPEQALTIASIHNAYSHIADKEDDPAFEQEIQNLQREYFVAWSKADTPFASGHEKKYEDEYFIAVAKDWLEYNLEDSELTESELEELGTKLDTCLKNCRTPLEERSAILCPLRIRKNELELNTIMSENTLTGPEKASRIAEIHYSLRTLPDSLQEVENLKGKIQDAMLDYFTDWAFTDKPFSSGSGLYSDNAWFSTLLTRWVNERLESVNLDAAQFAVFVEKTEDATKKYKLQDWNELRKKIRSKNAELCIIEEDGMTSTSDMTICRIAEMLLSGDVDKDNTALYRKGISVLADNYEKWVMMDPPFKMPSRNVASYQPLVKELLLDVLQEWKERELIADNIDQQTAEELKNRITSVYDNCRISTEYKSALQTLDIVIFRHDFDTIYAGNSITGDMVIHVAGIRKQMLDMNNPMETEGLCAETEDFLKVHMMEWVEASRPLSVEGYGYKDNTIPGIAEDWLLDDFRNRSWRIEQIQTIRSGLTDASKQYYMITGNSISPDAMRKIDLAECDILIRNVSTIPVNDTDHKDTQEKMLIRALNLYASLSESMSVNDSITRDLMPMLSQYYVTILRSAHFTNVPAAFIRLTDEWANNNLKKYPYDKLQDIRDLQELVIQKYREAGASREQCEKINLAFEMFWLSAAIDHKTDQPLSPSVLASEAAKIKALNGTPDARITDYLLERFADWAADGFRSEFNGKTYSYDDLPALARQWCRQTDFASYSADELERLSEKIERALSQGYALDDAEIENIKSPIDAARLDALFMQVVQSPTEEGVRQIRELYEEEPERYYKKVLPIFITLVRNNNIMRQTDDFIALQYNIWDKHRNDEVGRDTVRFLDELWHTYVNQRPVVLQNTMEAILKDLKYHLPAGGEHLDSWIRLRDYKLTQTIGKFFKDYDDPVRFADDWNRDKSAEIGLVWSEITDFESFRKALSDWAANCWKQIDSKNGRLKFIYDIKDAAEQAKEAEYKEQLLKLLLGFINDSYESISENAADQEKLDNIIHMIAANGIDTSSVQENPAYKAGRYRKDYDQLKQQWNRSLAGTMMTKRVVLPSGILSQIHGPGEFRKTEEWLILMILSTSCSETGHGYWGRILTDTGMPELKNLNEMDLRDVAETPFLDNIRWCYETVSGYGAKWATDDLRKYIYTEAPNMMRSINQGFPISGIKKLVKEGWRGLPEDFADWLRN